MPLERSGDNEPGAVVGDNAPVDPYHLLHVHPHAPRDLIAEAYWILAGRAKRAPTTRAAADARLRALNEAYSVLMDADRRHAYDAAQGYDAMPHVAVRSERRKTALFGFGSVMSLVSNHADYYHLLSLDREADPEIVELAAAMSLKRHAGLRVEDAFMRDLVAEAHRVLADPARRADYDASLVLTGASLQVVPPEERVFKLPPGFHLDRDPAPLPPDIAEDPPLAAPATYRQPAWEVVDDAPQREGLFDALRRVQERREEMMEQRRLESEQAERERPAPPPVPVDTGEPGTSLIERLRRADEELSRQPAAHHIARTDDEPPVSDVIERIRHLDERAHEDDATHAPDGMERLRKAGDHEPPRENLLDRLRRAAAERDEQARSQRVNDAIEKELDAVEIETATESARAESARAQRVADDQEKAANARPQTTQIVFIAGPRAGQTVPLARDTLSFGTDMSCDVRLEDDARRMPQEVARIWHLGDRYVFRQIDGGDVRIGGEKLKMPLVVLDDGDEITIGAHMMRFEVAAAPPDVPEAEPSRRKRRGKR